ncbi:MAG: histidine kinase [Taibaiella sp.]|nr:histidine kinase [Taibaiella sp.]
MQATKGNILATDKAAKELKKQTERAPYVMIVVFAVITMLLRVYLMPQFGWWHIPLLAYQVLVFTGFWHLIKYINNRLNNWYPFERGPLKRMALQNLVTLMAISPFALGGLYFAQDYLPDFVNEQFQATMLLMFVVVIFMFNFAFYSFHFFGNWQVTVQDKADLEIQAAELEREKSELQYHHLKNQVNPHYLFNMLTSLDGLVHTNPELASDFIRHMAKVYRYVLQHKESEVVNVEEELEFIEHYIQLLHIRYGSGLVIDINISEEARGGGIVMITLQMLIDNAIKHNIIQQSEPLSITIMDEGDYIVVKNNKQLRKQIETSNGKGLAQLRHLYQYLTDKEIIIEDKEESYTIKLPLL